MGVKPAVGSDGGRQRYEDANEPDLVTWAQAGDNEAMAELFDRYRRPLTFLAVSIAGNAGEDALMDVMCTFARRIKSFDPSRGKFSTWFRAVTVNQARKSARKSSTSKQREAHVAAMQPSTSAVADDHPLDAAQLNTPANLPDERALSRLWDQLRRRREEFRALERLTERERLGLIARHLLDLDDSEIATIFGVSPNTVRSDRSKAKKKLAHHRKPRQRGSPAERVA